jgi:cellulose synthase/poly-beta-1,6-N-acetylglucosamine synthase-like glycosyltransferase
VLHQSLPPEDYEIIVVNDGSKDHTAECLAGFQGIRVVHQENQGPAAARNAGAQIAQSEVVVFTDADCECDADFLAQITAPVVEGRAVGVQGSYKTRQSGLLPHFQQVETETRYTRMQQHRHIDFIGTYAAAYRRDVFLEFGGFDTQYPIASGEDGDLSFRISAKGHHLVFQPEAFVYHLWPETLRGYLRTKFFRGYWRVPLYRTHPGKILRDSYTEQKLKVQVLAVLLLPGLLLSAWWYPPGAWAAVCVLSSFLLFAIPFAKRFLAHGYSGVLFLPGLLFLRACSLATGLVGGLRVWVRSPV